MKIESITLNNIYSFKDIRSISLKDLILIVGPNNTGKTNIIRVLKTILDTLATPAGGLDHSAFFDPKNQAEIKIHLKLDVPEIDAIIGFLYFQCTCIKYIHPPKNKDKLRNYFKELALEFQWNMNDEDRPPSLQLKIKFKDLPLTFDLNNNRAISTYINKSRVFFNPNFLVALNEVDDISVAEEKLKVNDQEDIINSHISAYDLNATLLQHSELDKNRMSVIESFNDLNFYYRGEKEKIYTVWRLIHQIFKFGLYFSLRRTVEVKSLLDEAYFINNDGKNLANCLYTLKNSQTKDLNNIFRLIQRKFSEVFRDTLSFDVISKHENEQIFTSIIVDEANSKRFTLDKVGDGVIDTLLIMTLFYGQRDKVIFLDEPATNLHNTLLETIVNTILEDQNHNIIRNNQILIITHSEVLLNLLFYHNQLQILHCNKIGSETVFSFLDLQDPELKDLKLQCIFEPKVLLGKTNVVVEGQSDFSLLNGMSYYYSNDPNKRNMSLMRNDIVLTYAESKNNFPKYKAIFDKIGMKYYFIGDSDVEKGSKENIEKIFASPIYITPTKVITNNNDIKKNILVIKDGNLETLMEKIDQESYSKAIKEISKYGRGENKPFLAKLWLEFAYKKDKSKLSVFEDLFQILLS